jgi:hypothetical protein
VSRRPAPLVQYSLARRATRQSLSYVLRTMLACECDTFRPLELFHGAIDSRILASGSLRSRLTLVAEAGEHHLYVCPDCGTHWQRSLAWNWGNREYLFAVPSIELEAWNRQPFVQPDELLVFAAVLGRFTSQQKFEASTSLCRSDGCSRHAVKMSVFCLHDHILSLQANRMLPQDPVGTWFPPYEREGFAIP